ncbi:hypothetical protein F4678DRAFT_419621 [Xylaria arbuscula]|nr:hypothetical protein F4678DRAFT_419621 [Xylaria arbuscula]
MQKTQPSLLTIFLLRRVPLAGHVHHYHQIACPYRHTTCRFGGALYQFLEDLHNKISSRALAGGVHHYMLVLVVRGFLESHWQVPITQPSHMVSSEGGWGCRDIKFFGQLRSRS